MSELNIKYTKNSTNLQKEYLRYMWATDRSGKSLNVPQDGDDHALDAARYRLTEMFIPQIEYGGVR